MNYLDINKEKNALVEERIALVMERVAEIAKEPECEEKFKEYFVKAAENLLLQYEVAQKVYSGEFASLSLEQLKEYIDKMYADVTKEGYETSYANPAYAQNLLGKEYGSLFSVLIAFIRSDIVSAYRGEYTGICLSAELLVEIYVSLLEEDITFEKVKEHYYSFMHDNVEEFNEDHILRMINPDYDFYYKLIMESDLDDLSYLYRYGLPITENEIQMAKYLATFSDEKLQAMSDTFTEGYRIGFIANNKDLSKKTFADIRYPIGFERVAKKSAETFASWNLRSIMIPTATGMGVLSSTGTNKQYVFDHAQDQSIYFDRAILERTLEATRNVFERNKDIAKGCAGPAVIEVFGEEPFSPEIKPERLTFDENQNQMKVQQQSVFMQIYSKAIDMENRSFTIIAYPVPSIGEQFEEIFAETVAINTLDYKLYQGIQQKLIDVLDTADYVHILGNNGNKTDLKVKVHEIADPAHETAFENCVADVNIPVGEVFTSPVLEGTNGKLHVTQVYLNGLNYKNIEIDFEEGMIKNYNCTNFESEEENKKYIKDNVLFRHDTLPMGEFAIGTNTTAYCMARKYDIAEKLPILIAEKTGPHFAVGDTCYMYSEDLMTQNPDGKNIVARDNSVSILRKEDPSKAYFNCHTDITIPYDELGKITVVRKDGSTQDIIVNGRFVLEGTEELNKSLDAMNE